MYNYVSTNLLFLHTTEAFDLKRRGVGFGYYCGKTVRPIHIELMNCCPLLHRYKINFWSHIGVPTQFYTLSPVPFLKSPHV